MFKVISLFLVISLCSAYSRAGSPGAEPSGKPPGKIVFIAGPKDHGAPGAHEYEKDLSLLKKCLESSSNVKGLTTKLYSGRAPEDIGELRDASVIVIHSSGDGLARETHALFPQVDQKNPKAPHSPARKKYLEELDRLMKGGTGIVVLHYSLIVEHPSSRSYFLDWIGGYHKSGFSRVKIDRSGVQLATPGHPILNGVQPWTTDHEYYFNQYIPKDDKRVVPILTSLLPSDKPERHVIAWAVQRKGGGRGFAFTGGHFHKNMFIEDYRQMILNAIVWAAGLPVPGEGVASRAPRE